MYTTDFAYDGPIFLVPLSLSYPSSPVIAKHDVSLFSIHSCACKRIEALNNLRVLVAKERSVEECAGKVWVSLPVPLNWVHTSCPEGAWQS